MTSLYGASDNQEPATLTVGMLEAAFEKVREGSRQPHTHVVSRNGGLCDCGMWFTRTDVDRWLAS